MTFSGYQVILDKLMGAFELGFVPVIYGQTATGKTRLSLEFAKKLKEVYGKDVEIISADSRQVYRYMDIGTDKIVQDIRNQIIHHMIDIINPDEIYTAGQWQQDTYRIIDEIIGRGNIPMIVGGTGLYIDTIVYNFNMGIVEPDWEYRKELEQFVKSVKIDEEIRREEKRQEKRQEETQGTFDSIASLDQALPISENSSDLFKKEEQETSILWNLLNEIDPVEAAKHHPSSTRFIIRALEIYKQTGIRKSELMVRQKPKYPLLMIGLEQDTEIGNQMIDKRLELMIESGLVEEVQKLLDMGYSPELNSMKSIDYKQTIEYLQATMILCHDANGLPRAESCSILSGVRNDCTEASQHRNAEAFKIYMTNLQIANHQLAKKQRTWFRRYKRDSEACGGFDKAHDIRYLQFYLPNYTTRA